MSRCPSITSKGHQCKGIVEEGGGYCYAHSPNHREQRRRAASRAGRSRGGSEIHEVKTALRKLADDVLEGSRDRGDASVASQVLGVWLRCIETERRIKEQDELIGRLEALESRLEPVGPTGGGRRWGA